MNLSIKIFGAGVGGLSAAHDLIKKNKNHKNITIDVYEMKNLAGGLARTEGIGCNSKEISWRVYFHFYKHIFNIMKEIPSINSDGSNKLTVIDHLVPYENVFVPDNIINNPVSTIFNIIKLLMISDERLDTYDDISWYDYIKDGISDIPQWLGMDKFKGSTMSVERIGIEQSVIAKKIGHHQDYVLDGPTNDVWINPWVKYLQEQGVNFHFNSEVTNINVTSSTNEINTVELKSGEILKADVYILALPIEALAKLIPQVMPNAIPLSQKSRQIQLAFQMFLEKPLSFGRIKSSGTNEDIPVLSILLHNSPWNLIIEAKNISWSGEYTCNSYQWSTTICQSNTKGNYINKTFEECTEKEAQEEVLNQITSDKDFMMLLKQENSSFDGYLRVLKWTTMNDTYHFNPLRTSEPKFSNNVGTKKLRPSLLLNNNSYIATAYVYETIDIFSMEAAAIAGKKVAALILNSHENINLPYRPLKILAGFRFIDKLLLKCGLPSINVVLFFVMMVVFIYFLIKFLK